MLAQLDGVDGVAESRVNWTGRAFLVRLKEGADEERVAAAIAPKLGASAKRVDPAVHVASLRAGEPWMRSGETLKMSQHEAKVLGGRAAAKAAEASGVDAGKLTAIIEEELVAAFARIQGTYKDLDEGFKKEWPTLIERVKERSRAFATEKQAAAIGESLAAALGVR